MDDKTLNQYLQSISPSSVRSYAQAKGWESVEGSRRRIWLFRHPQERLVQLQVPMDRDEDTSVAILGAAERIAKLEKRPLRTVLEDLVTTGSDVLRFRIVSEQTRGGMLSLDGAGSLLSGAKLTIGAAACSVVNKVPHHPRTDRNEARQLLSKSHLGQTEVGSFVMKIVCPLDAVQDPPILEDLLPFTREVTTLLMRATSRVVGGIEQGNLDQILEEEQGEGASPEISSNLCKGLANLRGDRDDGEVELSVCWASSRLLHYPSEPQLIRMPFEYFPEIERAVKVLRPEPERDQERKMLGTVETLNGNTTTTGGREGEVILSLLLPDEEDLIRARVNLNPEDYSKAVTAHQGGQRYVELKGLLKRGVRVGRVEKLSHFNLLED